MTVMQFNQLTSIEKMNMLFDQGREISNRIYVYYNIKLYVLFDFFVEIWYRQASNKIDRLIVLNPADVLDIYENQIKLDDLIN